MNLQSLNYPPLFSPYQYAIELIEFFLNQITSHFEKYKFVNKQFRNKITTFFIVKLIGISEYVRPQTGGKV